MTSLSFTGRCRGVKCRHFPGFTALSHLAIATKISHSYHFHPTTNIPPNHQSWRMKIKNGCGKWFCKAPKKVWTAILDFIRRQEYFGGIIAMMPPKYPLPTLWERACQRLWCASDWSYCLGIAASNLVSHTMQMARTSGGDTKSLAVSARFFILEQSNYSDIHLMKKKQKRVYLLSINIFVFSTGISLSVCFWAWNSFEIEKVNNAMEKLKKPERQNSNKNLVLHC